MSVQRFSNNPIIKPGMPGLSNKLGFLGFLKISIYLTKRLLRLTSQGFKQQIAENCLGSNINGPSLIKVPDWVKKPLGKYYLYFAHHRGKYIRLAYADYLEGPWRIYNPGTLNVNQTKGFDHIASPDIHVINETQEIRMYFHTPYKGYGQVTMLATSKDGLNFVALPDVLGPFYFRVFKYKNIYYAIAKNKNVGGILLRSIDGITPFEEGPEIIPNLRHTAILLDSNQVIVFYSKIGDAPEEILASTIDLTKEWREWRPSEPISILQPEMEYEGVNLPIIPSTPGAVMFPVRQLRDPAIYTEDGNNYLLYTVKGEQGIAISRLLGNAIV
ncbi:conserved hypothetical protein [Rippkaea orientalis PCC 8801]|uniref:Glycosidase n=2 Tax=Rippkaea TaxID=2546365 RepID=B7K4B8_RIPO1|nr:conserved hypothetical protein [Rippkaea orientalis PCC 8801]